MGYLRTIESITSRTPRKEKFLDCLVSDLASCGIPATISTTDAKLRVSIQLSAPNESRVQRIYKRLRQQQIRENSVFIKKMSRLHVADKFMNGQDLSVEKISPRIRVCESRAEFALYKYCRLLQSVPSTSRIGRQICALVFDEGQVKPVLMGAIGLASSMYNLKCRDHFLGWDKAGSKLLKEKGLGRLMNLAVCIAVPPYSQFLAGKLMALFAMTDIFRTEFKKKYGVPLFGLETTCATGLHCPIFNRIMIKRGGLYRRIGETVGCTTIFFRKETMQAARRIAAGALDLSANTSSLKARPVNILRYALKSCGLSYTALLQMGNHKGVYFAVLSENCLGSLKSGVDEETCDSLSIQEAFEFWKKNFLTKRITCRSSNVRLIQAKKEQLTLEGSA